MPPTSRASAPVVVPPGDPLKELARGVVNLDSDASRETGAQKVIRIHGVLTHDRVQGRVAVPQPMQTVLDLGTRLVGTGKSRTVRSVLRTAPRLQLVVNRRAVNRRAVHNRDVSRKVVNRKPVSKAANQGE